MAGRKSIPPRHASQVDVEASGGDQAESDAAVAAPSGHRIEVLLDDDARCMMQEDDDDPGGDAVFHPVRLQAGTVGRDQVADVLHDHLLELVGPDVREELDPRVLKDRADQVALGPAEDSLGTVVRLADRLASVRTVAVQHAGVAGLPGLHRARTLLARARGSATGRHLALARLGVGRLTDERLAGALLLISGRLLVSLGHFGLLRAILGCVIASCNRGIILA